MDTREARCPRNLSYVSLESATPQQFHRTLSAYTVASTVLVISDALQNKWRNVDNAARDFNKDTPNENAI